MPEDANSPDDQPDNNSPEGADQDAPTPTDPPGQVVDLAIERELADSYLTYAMSTIVDRALPDVRDGLKPSQRRILVAMNDLNLSPGRKHSKCAGIVGETMKKYHPHGDGAIYPTLVNLAQEWKTRCLLIDKQGNFGSDRPRPPRRDALHRGAPPPPRDRNCSKTSSSTRSIGNPTSTRPVQRAQATCPASSRTCWSTAARGSRSAWLQLDAAA